MREFLLAAALAATVVGGVMLLPSGQTPFSPGVPAGSSSQVGTGLSAVQASARAAAAPQPIAHDHGPPGPSDVTGGQHPNPPAPSAEPRMAAAAPQIQSSPPSPTAMQEG